MNALKIPLDLSNGHFYENNRIEEKNMEKAVTAFIQLLIYSSNGDFKPDYFFGFSLKNCQYENIYMQGKNKLVIDEEINKRKNSDFAKKLKEVIQKFEPRLKKDTVEVSTFTKEENRNIKGKKGENVEVFLVVVVINIKGILINGQEYNKDFKLNIWS